MGYVVLVNWEGDCDRMEVYSTADGRGEAADMANRLCREVPGAYAEVVGWDEAAAEGLVS